MEWRIAIVDDLKMDRERLQKDVAKWYAQQEIDAQQIMDDLLALDRAVTDGTDGEELIGMMRGMIPTYRSPEEINEKAIAELEEERDRRPAMV